MPTFPNVGDAGTDTVSPPNDWATKLLNTLAVSLDTNGNLVSAYAKLGTNPASAGTVRLPNTGWIAGRNAANTGDVNMFRIRSSDDKIQVGDQLYWPGDGAGFGEPGASIKMRQARAQTSPGLYQAVDLYSSYSGLISSGSRFQMLRITAADASNVVAKTITNMTRVSTTVTVTAASHGFITGERIGIEQVTHTFNVEVNGAWTVANPTTNTFDITVPGLSSGAYTSGGSATNRAMMTGAEINVNPSVARTGLSGTALNADDFNGVVVFNGGTKKATDGFYIDNSGSIVGSAFLTQFSANASADYGLFIGKTQAKAGIWMNGTFTLNGILMDGSFGADAIKMSGTFTTTGILMSGAFTTYGIDTKAGTFTQSAVRLGNAQSIKFRNAADNADLILVGSNSSNEVTIGAVGQQGVRFGGSQTIAFGSGCAMSTDTTTGTKIGLAANEKWAFHNATPVVQHATTGETVGFTAGGGTTVTDASTFTGNVGSTAYRISDIVKALKNKGLMAA